MNAIIALCHFCEVHGPGSVFCTQTLRDSKIDENLFNNFINDEQQQQRKHCAACISIGNSLGMLSHDDESNANFLSSQLPVISSETITMVKHAATRSLSCEVSSQKDGGFVFFGDSSHGHVLAHTFQIRDAQARGFFRLFSFVIIMKDKTFLLNIQPFLAENMEIISKKLQDYSFSVYTTEQSTGQSERARRLNSDKADNRAPRSLSELTGEQHIFAELHVHFTWLLWAGARCLTETVTVGCPTVPPWVGKENEEGFSMIHMDQEEWLMRKYQQQIDDDGRGGGGGGDDDEDPTIYSLRRCMEILRSDFIAACYCALVGLQIILRGPSSETAYISKCLKRLLPGSLHKLIKMNSNKYLPPVECRILCVVPEVAVPQPSNQIFRVDFLGTIGDEVSVKWNGELPAKLPLLLVTILKAVNERLFNDFVLHKHLNLLVEEWKNKISCMKKITSNHDLAKIKKILGIQIQDQPVVNYWILHST